MTISLNSYSNYQNTINIRKNNNLQNNPQVPENQVAFKGITKNTLTRTQSNYKAIGLALSSLGVMLISALGIKSAKETSSSTSFKEIANKRSQAIDLEYYEGMSKYNKKLKKAYKRNPELVKDLMLSKTVQEHNCFHNLYDTSDLEYSHSAIALIEDYSQKYPELTELYKKCLSNSFINNFKCEPEIEKEILDLVTQKPKIAEKVLYQTGYKDTKNYDYNECYFPSKFLTELKKF